MIELLASIPHLIAGLATNPYVVATLGVLGAIGIFLGQQFLTRVADDVYQWLKRRLFGGKKRSSEKSKTLNDSSDFEPFDIETSIGKYHASELIGTGDIAAIYSGRSSTDKEIVIKLALNPGDNDLLQNEAKTLKLLHENHTTYSKHLPEYLDQFRSVNGHAGLVLGKATGYDLKAVRDKYPDGIPQQHIIWIFRRTLAIAGHAHSLGIIHANIEPAHIILSPEDHNIFLIDWGYSVYRPAETGQGFRAVNDYFSPPEVAERKPPVPASDLYSIGKCMIYVLGGNTQTDSMPDNVDERIQRFIKFFTRASALQRAQDAWEMYAKLDDLREEVFGPHQFLEFKM